MKHFKPFLGLVKYLAFLGKIQINQLAVYEQLVYFEVPVLLVGARRF